MPCSIQLLQGDCFDHLQHIADGSIDTILCDLPYGTTLASWDLALDLDRLWSEYLRITKPTSPIVLFASQPFTSKLILHGIEQYRHIWYWEKEKGTNHLQTRYQPLRVIEEVLVFAKATKSTYNPQMVPLDRPYTHTMPMKKTGVLGTGNHAIAQTADKRAYRTYTHAFPKNIVEFSRDKALVPTQKPLALMEYMVRTYSNPGDTVLDNTMGSGTTGVACKRLGRSFIGMELDEKHFAIAQDRIEKTSEDGGLVDELIVFPPA